MSRPAACWSSRILETLRPCRHASPATTQRHLMSSISLLYWLRLPPCHIFPRRLMRVGFWIEHSHRHLRLTTASSPRCVTRRAAYTLSRSLTEYTRSSARLPRGYSTAGMVASHSFRTSRQFQHFPTTLRTNALTIFFWLRILSDSYRSDGFMFSAGYFLTSSFVIRDTMDDCSASWISLTLCGAWPRCRDLPAKQSERSSFHSTQMIYSIPWPNHALQRTPGFAVQLPSAAVVRPAQSRAVLPAMKPSTSRAFALRRWLTAPAPGPESLSLGSLGVARASSK